MEQGLFKTVAFGGFQKEQVLQYIAKADQEAQQTEKTLNERIQEMNQASAQLEEQVAQYGEKIATLEEQLQRDKTKIQELTDQVTSLNEEVSRHKLATAKAQRELEIQKACNRQLEERNQALQEKEKQWDAAAAQIGDTLLQAQASAQQMLQQASQKAKDIQTQSMDSVSNVTRRLDQFRLDLQQLKEQLERSTQLMQQRVSELELAIDQAQKHLTSPDENGSSASKAPDPQPLLADEKARAAEQVPSFFRAAAHN